MKIGPKAYTVVTLEPDHTEDVDGWAEVLSLSCLVVQKYPIISHTHVCEALSDIFEL